MKADIKYYLTAEEQAELRLGHIYAFCYMFSRYYLVERPSDCKWSWGEWVVVRKVQQDLALEKINVANELKIHRFEGRICKRLVDTVECFTPPGPGDLIERINPLSPGP